MGGVGGDGGVDVGLDLEGGAGGGLCLGAGGGALGGDAAAALARRVGGAGWWGLKQKCELGVAFDHKCGKIILY